jgi:hypothetical protein
MVVDFLRSYQKQCMRQTRGLRVNAFVFLLSLSLFMATTFLHASYLSQHTTLFSEAKHRSSYWLNARNQLAGKLISADRQNKKQQKIVSALARLATLNNARLIRLSFEKNSFRVALFLKGDSGVSRIETALKTSALFRQVKVISLTHEQEGVNVELQTTV